MNPGMGQDVSNCSPCSAGRERPQFFRSPLLTKSLGVTHAFTTRTGGVSPSPYDSLNLSSKTGDSDENVSENIRILKAELGIDEDPLFMDQVHGDEILFVDNYGDASSASSFDAVITNAENLPLVVITADCLPILLYDRARSVAAAVHAGWKGTALNIAGKTVAAMTARFGSNPEDIIAAMGPFIGPCCYEVDETVVKGFEPFIRSDAAAWSGLFSPSHTGKEGKWMFDLAGANLLQLKGEGIKGHNISLSPYCTCCRDGLFYSYRREGAKTGRQGAILMIDKRCSVKDKTGEKA